MDENGVISDNYMARNKALISNITDVLEEHNGYGRSATESCILAKYMVDCLVAYEEALHLREA